MSDYTEHLISMAGGDGDALDLEAIQARVDAAEESVAGLHELWVAAIADVPALLALVRKQQSAINDLLYIADNKADLTKPAGQWWSEVIKGAIERHMGKP